MMKMRSLRIAAASAAGVLLAGALSAQTVFHKLVVVGDSLGAGHEGNCTVKRYQLLGASKLLADAIGQTDFQQALIDEAPPVPLTSYPCLGAVPTTTGITVGIISQEGGQLNASLPRPFDNLAARTWTITRRACCAMSREARSPAPTPSSRRLP